MVTSDKLQEMIFDFLKSSFSGETFKTESLDLSLEKEMFALFQSNSLTVSEVKQLPKNKQKFVFEFVSQYLMFLSINSEITFPESFHTPEKLGSDFLAYMLEHKWPYPQMLK